MESKKKYISPFSTRYASEEMQYLFSEDFKFKTWRRLWIALAKAEKELGLNITDEQIAELEANAENINFSVAVLPYLRPGCVKVCQRICGVNKLSGDKCVRYFLGKLLGLCYCTFHSFCTLCKHKLGSICLKQISSLNAHGIRKS